MMAAINIRTINNTSSEIRLQHYISVGTNRKPAADHNYFGTTQSLRYCRRFTYWQQAALYTCSCHLENSGDSKNWASELKQIKYKALLQNLSRN